MSGPTNRTPPVLFNRTPPVLFVVFHLEGTRSSSRIRQERGEMSGFECGFILVPWVFLGRGNISHTSPWRDRKYFSVWTILGYHKMGDEWHENTTSILSIVTSDPCNPHIFTGQLFVIGCLWSGIDNWPYQSIFVLFISTRLVSTRPAPICRSNTLPCKCTYPCVHTYVCIHVT